jgi:cbb3-type cytochrome oxidase subunit 3
VRVDPPLTPAPEEARSWLRRELLHPDYHEDNLLQRFLAWLQRQLDRGLTAAQDASPLTTLALMVTLLLLVAGLAWLLSRARRSARSRERDGAVLPTEKVTADALRSRAERSLAEGNFEEALLDGFRAVAVRQVERGRLEDSPGATAHEVADNLAASYPGERERVGSCARLFDQVLYGHRPATREQATEVLALEDALVVRR